MDFGHVLGLRGNKQFNQIGKLVEWASIHQHRTLNKESFYFYRRPIVSVALRVAKAKSFIHEPIIPYNCMLNYCP